MAKVDREELLSLTVINAVCDASILMSSRGISSDSFQLPSKGAKTTLVHRPPPDLLSALKSGTVSWSLAEVACFEQNAAETVVNNQERLREASAKRFGTAADVVRGLGPSPSSANSDTTVDNILGCTKNYLSDEMFCLTGAFLEEIEKSIVNDWKIDCSSAIGDALCTLSVPPNVSYESGIAFTRTGDRTLTGELIDSSAVEQLRTHSPSLVDSIVESNHDQFKGEEHGFQALTDSYLQQNQSVGLTVVEVAKARTGVQRSSKGSSLSFNDASSSGSSVFKVEELKELLDILSDDDDDDDDTSTKNKVESTPSPAPVIGAPGVTSFLTEVDELNASAAKKQEEVDPNPNPKTSGDDAGDVDALLNMSHPVPITQSRKRDVSLSQAQKQVDASNSNSADSMGTGKTLTSWAVTSSLDESEFEILRPRMAVQFPFELDFFQKQAVMRLERRECVFVAAHTSAGKTIVAEYAVAMARKHMTRTIYTSPIKALSNQKYRDFRDKFGDSNVGLITGDVSVNPDASCSIMTTEILRSMLYRGADTIRDIEWVIFDEVHYVNDAERGVVWEEVIIMLPDRINLIFLSATTPNTVEFSDWIGRTKRRKVFVVSTNKRPVPLQHYMLYDEEVYSLVQAEGQFNASAIALAAKREKDKLKPKEKSAENVAMAAQRSGEKAALAAQYAGRGGAGSAKGGGSAGGRGGGGAASAKSSGGVSGRNDIAGSKTQWITLLKLLQGGGRAAAGGLGAVDFGLGDNAKHVQLKQARQQKEQLEPYERLPPELRAKMTKKEYERTHVRAQEEEGDSLLPAVIFSFSKKKCEEIADFLKGQDLLNAKEKGEVRAVISQVSRRLNPLDARLPQVKRIEEMLNRGIAVHHGGLLPILKECVELLFSKSVVKVLIATETFAMGVNMPARSVVFNGFRKHDGKGFRDLLPGEYTQMAGRAGRRGLDRFGTVIVAAWQELPAEAQLKKLLTGTATKLSSQFRLSYNMILNLIRVNDLSVEDMIKRSFSEFHTQRALAGHDLTRLLAASERKLQKLKEEQSEEECLFGDTDIEDYYNAFDRARRRQAQQLQHMLQTKRSDVGQVLAPGRVVYVHHVDTAAAVVPGTSASAAGDKTKTVVTPVGQKTKSKSNSTSCPRLAVVLTDPTATGTSTTTSAAAGLGSGLGLGGSMSDLRASLGVVTGPTSVDNAIGGAGAGSDSKEMSAMKVWVLILLPDGSEPVEIAKPVEVSTTTTPTASTSGLNIKSLGGNTVTSIGKGTGSGPNFNLLSTSKGIQPQPLSAAAGIGNSVRAGGVSRAGAGAGADSVPVGWSEFSAYADVDSGAIRAYWVVSVDVSSIGIITNKKLTAPPSPSPSPTPPALSGKSANDAEVAMVRSLQPAVEQLILLSDEIARSSDIGCEQSIIEPLNLAKEFRVNDFQFVENQMLLTSDSVSCLQGKCHRCPKLQQQYKMQHQISTLTNKISSIRHYISNENLSLFPDFQQRLGLLKLLGYVDGDKQTATLKGRVACEMNTCDELIATEMIFNNVLEPLNPPEAAAVLSALVFQEKNNEDPPLTSRMEIAKSQMQDIFQALSLLQEQEGVAIDPDSKPSLNFGLVAVVYQWARGMSFKEITDMTLTHEGSIVRCITRLEELCKDVRNAARVIGNPSLYRKMEAASQCIKRDIVFAASLYIS